MTAIRTGIGYDVHQLVPQRRLILGGVVIEHHLGLAGHSDADVLCHAVTDACLGACALGDIGQHFSDQDPRYAGADSLGLLKTVSQMCREAGWVLGNLDATVIAQAPKLAPHINQMRGNIAAALDANITQISIKATTTEHLGFTGREEGIAAVGTVLMVALP